MDYRGDESLAHTAVGCSETGGNHCSSSIGNDGFTVDADGGISDKNHER